MKPAVADTNGRRQAIDAASDGFPGKDMPLHPVSGRSGFTAAIALLLIQLTACGAGAEREVVITGKTVYAGMAIEEVRIRVFRLDGGRWEESASGRSGYHGAFIVKTRPGVIRLEAGGMIFINHREIQLAGRIDDLQVPSDIRRMDRIVIELASVPDEGNRSDFVWKFCGGRYPPMPVEMVTHTGLPSGGMENRPSAMRWRNRSAGTFAFGPAVSGRRTMNSSPDSCSRGWHLVMSAFAPSRRVDGHGRAKYHLDTSRGACPERGGLRSYPLNLIRIMPAQGSQRDARPAMPRRVFLLEEMGVKLTVNGESYETKRPESVTALLEEMGIGGRAVVVVVNDEVVPASSRSACGLREGDCVELFRLVGGG